MQVDGRVVGQALSRTVRPLLRERGSWRFQGRHAWRRREHAVDLISFPSMNAYVAEGVGSTSFSFSGAAGVYYPEVADIKVEWPRDYHLTFRGFLGKTIRQPIFHPFRSTTDRVEDWQRDRPDVWYVLEDGSNLDEVCTDVVSVVLTQGLPFIDRVGNPNEALVSLDTEAGRDTRFGELGLFAPGQGSPQWQRTRDGLVALIARTQSVTG